MQDEAAGEQNTKELRTWKAWDEFLESKTNTSFMQSSWYATFYARNGRKHFGTVVRDGETIVGGTQVFSLPFAPGKCFYYIASGPVFLESDSIAEQEQVFRAIMEFIEGRRQNDQHVVSHLCINPRWEHVPCFVTGFQESNYYYGLPRDTQCVNLSPSENSILAQMKPKGRYNIGVARRYGVSIIEDVSLQGIEDFINITNETFARKNLNGLGPAYYRRLISMLSASNRGSVFFAEYQGTRLATAIVVYFGCTATYFYGGSRTIHRNVMAPYLLHFEIMRRAKVRGCQCYDLFGVTPQNEPSDGWTDISVFKRKFGGQEIRFVPTLEYIYDPVAYQEWEAIKRDRRENSRAPHELVSVDQAASENVS